MTDTSQNRKISVTKLDTNQRSRGNSQQSLDVPAMDYNHSNYFVKSINNPPLKMSRPPSGRIKIQCDPDAP